MANLEETIHMHISKICRILILIISFLVTTSSQAQDDLPQDYLPKEFHKGRREAARNLLPANSVLVVAAAPTRTFSNDVEYLYHQNPDLYYFTGYKEPNALLFIFKEPQQASDGTSFTELFFVQKRDPLAEQWNGRRLGTEGVKNRLGIQNVYNGDELKTKIPDFSKFDKIIFDQIPQDVSPTNQPGALYQLLAVFREKSGIPTDLNSGIGSFFEMVKNNGSYARLSQLQRNLENRIKNNPQFATNKQVQEFLLVKDSASLETFKRTLEESKYSTSLFRQITGALREIKTPEELSLIRKAVEISCQGQNEVMKAVRPDMSELEIQGLHEFVHKKYGAEHVGYGSIIGAGENGCILHYMENTKTKVGTEMLLMDVGAEYHGYTADVTRTIPVDGKFGTEERAIYQIVYDAQEAAFRKLKDGADWSECGEAAREVIANGLMNLGIIKNKSEVGKYYPHGLGHHIGLDVHDRSSSRILKKDMVITIEPGIYIPSNSPCDKKWWGISVRIEDDALITQNGYELLSSFAPRSIEAIEKMIAEKSLLDEYRLPPLKSGEKKKAF